MNSSSRSRLRRCGVVLAAVWLAAHGGSCSGESSGSGGDGGTTTTVSGPSCVGEPKPCEERSPGDCEHFQGCNDDGACKGQAVGCQQIPDEPSCAQQFGCVWMPSSGQCGGEPDSCPSIQSNTLCSGQIGCGWEAGACGGFPYGCYSFTSESTCYGQTGCSWE